MPNIIRNPKTGAPKRRQEMATCSTCLRREGVTRHFTVGKYAAHQKRYH